MGVPTVLSGLLKLAEARIRGPSPSFDRAQLVFAFLTIGASGTIGRAALAKKAMLGEGAVRTVLKRLRSSGYVEAGASGCRLSTAGAGVYRSLKRKLSDPLPLGDSQLTVGRLQVAFAVRGGGRLVKGGLEQRDSAVRAGASGATTYVMKGGKFTMPAGSLDCEKDFPSPVWENLRTRLRPQDGDAVILCGSGDETSATLGALSAALTLF
jgi:hypothetical protein